MVYIKLETDFDFSMSLIWSWISAHMEYVVTVPTMLRLIFLSHRHS